MGNFLPFGCIFLSSLLRLYLISNEMKKTRKSEKNFWELEDIFSLAQFLGRPHFDSRARYPALGHFVFFLNEKKINICHLMHIALFLKVIY